ncbi:MAG: dUTPase [Lactobacillaceae bacterium]|jgi:hypothetical protein|nr:dUTPase [Lactobacillaceae bacterium]
MELAFAEYLRLTREMTRTVTAEWERPIKQNDLLLNDYLNLQTTLAQLLVATAAVNANVPTSTNVTTNALQLYAQGLVQFLAISLRQQWTHLMVMEETDLKQFSKFPQQQLAHQFMGIQTMLLNSYHQKVQRDFAHAWRSYLKLGLVELKFSATDLDLAIRELLNA